MCIYVCIRIIYGWNRWWGLLGLAGLGSVILSIVFFRGVFGGMLLGLLGIGIGLGESEIWLFMYETTNKYSYYVYHSYLSFKNCIF